MEPVDWIETFTDKMFPLSETKGNCLTLFLFILDFFYADKFYGTANISFSVTETFTLSFGAQQMIVSFHFEWS